MWTGNVIADFEQEMNRLINEHFEFTLKETTTIT